MILCGVGIISGASFFSFSLAIFSSILLRWIVYFISLRFRFLFVSLDPDNPNKETLSAALHAAIQSVQQQRRALLVRLLTPPGPKQVTFTLRMDREGALLLEQSGSRKVKLGFENQWIAEHPLPFRFSGRESTILQMLPTPSERVRVGLFSPKKFSPVFLILLFLIVFSSFILGIEWLSAISGGIGVQAAFMQYRS